MVQRSATRVPNPDYPPTRTTPGALARLATEDWHQMTAKANASANHVSSDERWTKKAREANPALDDDQAYRLGQLLKRQFFQEIGKKSVQARRLAREARRLEVEAQAEFADAQEAV